MSNKFFYVHNGLTVGALTVDATSGDVKTSGAFTTTNTTIATNTQTGALQVAGGAGIGGSLYATAVYSNNSLVLSNVTPAAGTGISVTSLTTGSGTTSFTINNTGVTSLAGSTYIGVSQSTGAITVTNLGVQTLTAGTGTVVSSNTGTITVWSSETLQTVTNKGASTNVALSITNTSNSASTSSGQALLVSGGIGALTLQAATVFDGGNRVLTNVVPTAGTAISVTSVSTTSGTTAFTINNTGVTSAVGSTYLGVSGSTGAVTFTNLGVQTLTAGTGTVVSSNTGTITVWSSETLQSVTSRGATSDATTVSLTGGTQSTATTNGTLVVTGGVGVSQNLNVGGALTVAGAVTFSSPVTFSGTATYVLSTNTVYTDNILELHTPPSGVSGTWTVDDGKDVGLRFHYYNRTLAADANAALVLANDSQVLEWYGTGAENSSGTFVGAAYGTFKTGNITLTSGTNATTTNTGALVVQGGVGIWNDLRVGGTVYSNGTALTNFNTGTLVSQANSSYNIVGGAPGYIPIQSASGVTSFIQTGTVGYILTMATGNTATWQALSSLTAGAATTATDLAGGVAGNIPIQSAPGITTFINLGAAGTLLQATSGNTATFVTTASLYVGNAANAVTATNVSGGTVNATTIQASGTSTFSNTVVVSSSPVVYDQTGVSVGLTAVTIDTFALATYRSAKYVVTVSNSGNTAYQSTEVLVIHDGTTPYLQDVSVFTGVSPIMTFSTTISGGNVLLQGTGTATGNLVKVQRIYTTV